MARPTSFHATATFILLLLGVIFPPAESLVTTIPTSLKMHHHTTTISTTIPIFSRSPRPATFFRMSTEGGGGEGGREKETEGKSRVLTKLKEKVEVEAKAKSKIKNEGMWRVLLHNDEIHTFDYVTHSIVKTVKQLSR